MTSQQQPEIDNVHGTDTWCVVAEQLGRGSFIYSCHGTQGGAALAAQGLREAGCLNIASGNTDVATDVRVVCVHTEVFRPADYYMTQPERERAYTYEGNYKPNSAIDGYELKGSRWREDARDGSVTFVARNAGRGGGWLRLTWRPTRFVWFAIPGEPRSKPDGTWHVSAYKTKREAIAWA